MVSERVWHYDLPRLAGTASEIQIQKACRDRVAAQFKDTLIVAVPNGTFIASKAGRGKANREGRSKGFPDTIILGPGRVAFAEFKARTSLKPEQANWLDQLHNWGFPCGVFRSQDTLAAKLREWGFR